MSTSYRPAYDSPRHEHTQAKGQRELTLAGRLEPAEWRASAEALQEFLDRARRFTQSDVEKAISDAINARRFNSAAATTQRHHFKMYMTVCNLMREWGLRELPWPTRELDKVLADLARDPTVRSIDSDFDAFMTKFIRNGAFDHLAGLKCTLIMVQYLPKSIKPSVQQWSKSETALRAQEISRPASRADLRQASIPKDVPTGPRVTGTIKITPSSLVWDATKADSVATETKVVNTDTPTTVVRTAPLQDMTAVATTPASTEAIRSILPVSSAAHAAIIQGGLEVLSEANMMPIVHQYDLLNDVLRLIERACFFWAEKHIPDILKKKKWNAWQKVELLDWLEIFATPELEKPLDAHPKVKQAFLDDVTPGLKQMRNDAITRKELPIATVAKMMGNAQILARLLRDEACKTILTKLSTDLTTIDNRAAETRARLKVELQREANSITRKYQKMMEDEIRKKSISTSAELEQHLESQAWNFKFVAPDDDHYAGKVANTNTAGTAPATSSPKVLVSSMAGINGVQASIAPTATMTAQDNQHRQAEDSDSAMPVNGEESGPPPRGTLAYETFCVAHRATGGLPQVALVSEALALDKPTWESLRQAATAAIEDQGLLDVRWKDILALHPAAVQKFKVEHQQLFKDVRLPAFVDLLCELTFHSARRGIVERERRKQSKQRADEEEAATAVASPAVTHDPRIRIREARQARAQEASMEAAPVPTQARGFTASLSRDARQANLAEQESRLAALRASTSAANRQPAVEARSSRIGADAYFDDELTARRGMNKRSLSPSNNHHAEAGKRIKTEQTASQEDILPGESAKGFDSSGGYTSFSRANQSRAGTQQSIESGEIFDNRDSTFSANRDYVSLN